MWRFIKDYWLLLFIYGSAIVAVFVYVFGCVSPDAFLIRADTDTNIAGIATTQPVKIVGVDEPVVQAFSQQVRQAGHNNVQNIGDAWTTRLLVGALGAVGVIVSGGMFYLAYLVSHTIRKWRQSRNGERDCKHA